MKAETYPFVVRPLPYEYDALIPVLDEETLTFHHDKHYKTYVDNLNAALQGYSQNSEVRVEVQRGEDSQQAQQQQTNPDGHNHNQQQQQQHQEETHDGDFMQKLRLGLFGLDDTI